MNDPHPTIDTREYQRKALEHTSAMAGAYVEALGSTDVALWSRAQWEAFLALIVAAFQDGLARAYGDDPPF